MKPSSETPKLEWSDAQKRLLYFLDTGKYSGQELEAVYGGIVVGESLEQICSDVGIRGIDIMRRAKMVSLYEFLKNFLNGEVDGDSAEIRMDEVGEVIKHADTLFPIIDEVVAEQNPADVESSQSNVVTEARRKLFQAILREEGEDSEQEQ